MGLNIKMTDIAIRVENLSKQYRIGGPQARYKTIRESLTEAAVAPFRRLPSVVHNPEEGRGHRCTQIYTDKCKRSGICVHPC